MAYQPNKPQPTDRLRTSQGDLLGNFQASAGGLGTMLNPNQGYIQFPNQGAVPTLTATQPGMFAKLITNPPYPVGAVTGVSELFLNKNSFRNMPVTNQIPFSASILSTANPTATSAGWTYLPSGIIMQWGWFMNATNGQTVNFALTFPNSQVSLQLTESATTADGRSLTFGNFTTSGFNIGLVAPTVNKSGYYLALGF